MENKKTILILYSDGMYDVSAEAIAEYFKEMYADVNVVAIGDDSYSSFFASRFRRKHYIFSVRNAPWALHVKEWMTRSFVQSKIIKTKRPFKPTKVKEEKQGAFSKWLKTFAARYNRISNIIMRFDPDIIVCCGHSALYKSIKARHKLKKPLTKIYGLLTDYVLDKRFVHYKADGYLVENLSIAKSLEAYNISNDKIHVVGMPMPKSHLLRMDNESVKNEFNITNDLPIVAFIGGRYGANYLKSIFSKFLDNHNEYNIVALTGGSTALAKFFSDICKAKGVNQNVYIVEEIDAVAKVYALADVVICSPTACVTYEAIYNNVPCILIKPNTVVDKGNAEYLYSNMLAIKGYTIAEVFTAITRYEDDADYRETLRVNQVGYCDAGAAATAGDLLYSAAREVKHLKMNGTTGCDSLTDVINLPEEVKE